MSTSQEYLLAPAAVRVEFALDPVTSLLSSLLMIKISDQHSGLGEWVYATAKRLTPAQRKRLAFVADFAFDALRPRRIGGDVESYLKALEGTDARAFRDRVFDHVLNKLPAPADAQALLRDEATFVAHWRTLKGHKGTSPARLQRLHGRLNAPETLHRETVAFLKTMWAEHFRSEWTRVRPLLEASVEAFQQLDFAGLAAPEAVRRVIGRDLAAAENDDWSVVQRLCFVPSTHIGPYALKFIDGDLMWLVYGAKTPEGGQGRFPDLTRAELLVKLGALVDEIRLQVIELLTRHDELSAQELMDRLKQSQSTISRHLIHLHTAGFLDVRRQARGKKLYRLNPARIDAVLAALREFFKR